ncbi:MAG: crossover junction endodeoxyribonuclease RuvC [Alphaproteobacteria bacterium]|nr:crossover junction endodeoxyribonuclease RuvC [Alphaproteobacteria bacterium]
MPISRCPTPSSRPRAAEAVRIIGIDPGLRFTGWGIIEQAGTRLTHVAHGVVTAPREGALSARLAAIFDAVEAVLAEHTPGAAAIEETFVNRDARATLKLGQARAAAMLAAARAGLEVAEYAPNLVKKSVVGRGHADKAQIRFMVMRLLPGCALDSEDAADALAVAITHAHHAGGPARLVREADR